MTAYGLATYGLGLYGVGPSGGVPLSGITAADWIERTRQYLLSQHREEQTTLAAPYNVGDGQVQLTTAPPTVQYQAYLEIDLELFFVTSVSNNTAFIVPAQLGTRPTAHAQNAMVSINPRFPRSVIFGALQDTLRNIGGPSYYSVGTVQLTWNPPQFGYDLGVSGVNFIYDIDFPLVGQSVLYPRVYNYELKRNQPTSIFPSGNSLQFYEVPGVQQGQIINVTYFGDFSLLPDATANTDVSVTGLPPSGYDLPPIGAAIRLMAGREVKRNFIESQSEPRRAAEITPGAIAASVNGLKQLWADRMQSETDSLAQMYPRRKVIRGRHGWSGAWR